ncbi:MAG: ABC-F family ATP-binding cassette domain-containing protein [Clostridium sp.]|nr:ABC-F family ATP-binding cassette domain-containing protein [Clostridium sp.]
MRYQIRHALVQYGADTILEDVNFEIHDHEKIAVVGRNGCGKTTLLKLIHGDITMNNLDSDETCGITMAGKQEIGFLHQISFPDADLSVEEEIKKTFAAVFACEARMKEIERRLESGGTQSQGETQPQGGAGQQGAEQQAMAVQSDGQRRLLGEYNTLQRQMEALRGYTWRRDMEIMFQQFGFALADLQRPIGSFSGGQQTKIAFIKLLLSRPDIMLLDEPTNHLDLPTIEWLEGYLQKYDKAVVIVSHDRMFLDRVIDVTYEIEYHRIKRYPGNYTAFMKRKEEDLQKQEKDYEAQQKEIKRLTEWIEKWKNTPTKVASAHSKQMAIEHMVKIEKPRRFDTKTFRAMFTPRMESYTEVLNVRNLKIGYDKELADVSFLLEKGQKLAILGENGIGKSTLLKTLVGLVEPLSGRFSFGQRVEWGYFDQQEAVMNDAPPEQTVLDNFWEEYPKLLREEVRGALGAFLFSGEDVMKQMGQLSGGEKVRLELCKMFYRKPNLLILDEPTNHMDMAGKDALEKMLGDFPGTILFVSHDRYFVSRIATGVLEFETDGVRQYRGGYEAYLAEKQKRLNGLTGDTARDGRNAAGQKTGGAQGQKPGAAQTGRSAAGQKPESAQGRNPGAAQAGADTGGPRQGSTEAGTNGGGVKNPTLGDVFDKKTYYNPGKVLSRLKKQLEKYEKQLAESEARAAELSLRLMEPDLASDYQKLMELQEQLDGEEHLQETLLERMMETETELQEMEQA